jgi:diaminohydroxyphosphoribosylaminopyrimidine deaminase / 5-amino-6-(5-phosphoribosylamino)uracil reductase
MASDRASQDLLDRRFMAAALRLSGWNEGRTSTNPSVGTLIVRDDGAGPVIVGRGITALGGRPHAETQALDEAGELARGATAYVTLEPCAHHGRTPPCAEALITAGVARVVGAASDPDSRVSGKGYAMLRKAGIEVVENVLAAEAQDLMAAYLIRSSKKRAHVTLKLALSRDGMIGRLGAGQVAITGPTSRRQAQLMRARSDAILVGINTAVADDPWLTVRLPGLESRSPVRIVIDRQARLPLSSKLVVTVLEAPLMVAVSADADPRRRSALEKAGVTLLAAETFEGRVALPELLEDLAARGISSVLVEGGAETARYFLEEELVDRIALFRGEVEVGDAGIASPIDESSIPAGFELTREAVFDADRYFEWARPI